MKTKKKIYNYLKKLNKYKKSIFFSLIFLFLSVFLSILSSEYAETKEVVSVPDLILDSIDPVPQLSFLFVYFPTIIALVLTIYLLFFSLEKAAYCVNPIELVYVIRSISLILTQLGPARRSLLPSMTNYLGNFYRYNNDLFFSGHVALPFLCFLIFRKEKIGVFFFCASVIMTITVLLVHAHYSIDVLGAFFITYGSYKIGQWIKKDIIILINFFYKVISFLKDKFLIVIHCYYMSRIIKINNSLIF